MALKSEFSILVVEDEGVVAEGIKERLIHSGFDVAGVVDSGEGAIAAAMDTQPDLILMDIRLKGNVDGIEAAEQIGRDLDIPVVYLTALSDLDTLERAKASGPFGYVLKPFHERDLVVAIEVAASRHVLERRLRESEQRYAATLASIADAVITTDVTARVVFMNQSAQVLTGWAFADAFSVLVENVLRFIDETKKSAVENPLSRAIREGVVIESDHTLILVARDNTHIPIECSVALITDVQYRVIGSVIAFRDIRSRRRAEAAVRESVERRRQTASLDGLGALAAGVSHNFNNLLMIILGYAQMAMLDESPGSRARGHLQKIVAAAQRGGNLTEQLVSYAGQGVHVVRNIELSELIQSYIALLKGSLPKRYIIRCDLGRGSTIAADTTQLRQIIFSLVMNAMEAIGDTAGTITIRTDLQPCSRATLSNYTLGEALSEGEYVYLEVSDTGSGMDDETRARIFEPFFTTKAAGRGLGLSAVLGITRAHGGAIRVASKPDMGTTIQLIFPLVQQDAAKKSPNRIAPPDWRGHGAILVVDDEEGIRDFSQKALEGAGFTVLTAADGVEALSVFAANSDSIVAVLMDVSMPRMDGIQALRELRRHRPNVRVILSTGYAPDPGDLDVAGFLTKPYGLDDLLNLLYRVLNQDGN